MTRMIQNKVKQSHKVAEGADCNELTLKDTNTQKRWWL